MARSLTGGMVAQVTAKTLAPFLAAEFKFEGGDVLAWTGIGDLSFDGKTFKGVGSFGGVSDIEETQEMRAVNVTFTLSGVSSDLVAISLDNAYQNRLATLWFGVLDAAGSVVSNPYQMFQGRMDVLTLDDDGETSTLAVSCESRLVDLKRTAGWTYTTADQEALGFAGDRGFRFVPRLQDAEIIWRDQPDKSGAGSSASRQSRANTGAGKGARRTFNSRTAAQDAAGGDDIVAGGGDSGFYLVNRRGK